MYIVTRRKKIPFGKKTLLMGILNVTPDSFSDGGLFLDPKKAIDHAMRMKIQGADIIDIGGESVRIDASKVSVKEELRRILPVLVGIREKLGNDIIISVDTYKSQVAEKAVEEGADIVNDTTGFQIDPKMPQVVGKTGTAVVVTHMRNRLGIHQESDDVVGDSSRFFKKQLDLCKTFDITKEQIILDPGYGFCKTLENNLKLIKHIDTFKTFRLPILIAVSRKASLGRILHKEFQSIMEYGIHERLTAALAATAIGVLGGASIVRTHDVYETKNFITVLDKLRT